MVPPGTEPSLNGPRSPRLQRTRDGSRFGLNPGNIRTASGSRSEAVNSRSADMHPYIDLKTSKRYSQLSRPTTEKQSKSQAPNEYSSPKSGRGNLNQRQSPTIDPDLLSIKPSAKVTSQLFKAIASTGVVPRQPDSQGAVPREAAPRQSSSQQPSSQQLVPRPSVPRQPASQQPVPQPSVSQQPQTLGHANYDHKADETQLQSTDIDDYNEGEPPGEFHYEGSDEFEGRDFFNDPEEFGQYKYDPSKDPEADLDPMMIGAL